MFSRALRTFGLLVVVTVSLGAARPSRADIVITGIHLYETDELGNYGALDFWNTNGYEVCYNAYVVPGSDPGGAFANWGNTDHTGVNLPLHPGTNHFLVFAEPGANYDWYRIDLFFDGPDLSSGISAYRNVQPGMPLLAAGGGAGDFSLTSADGQRVTLTDFRWNSPVRWPEFPDTDRVSGYDTLPSGTPDFTGHFTLEVTPEPCSLALLGAGLALAARRRKRRA